MAPRTHSGTTPTHNSGNPASNEDNAMNNPGVAAASATAQGSAMPASADPNSSTSSPALSSILSPVGLLRHRLGDGHGLMDDRFYISALLATDGDVEAAGRLIEEEGSFDLVDEELTEGLTDADQVDMETLIEHLEAPPTATDIAGNPGPWNPRPGGTPNLNALQRETLGIFLDVVYPHVVDEDVLADYLRDNNWDVVAAHGQWETDRAEAMTRSRGRRARQPDSELLNFMMESGVPFNNNIEQERRDAARVFRDAIHAEFAPTPTSSALLSISEAILILLQSNFNLTGVFQDFVSRQEELQGQQSTTSLRASFQADLSPVYDRMRVSTDDRIDQDERLAILATITQRADLAALESLLETYEWDLIRAIVAWYKTGVSPQRHPRDRSTNKALIGYNRRTNIDGTLRRMPTKYETTVADRVERGWALEVREYAAGGQQVRPPRPTPSATSHLGSVINEDSWPVRPGAPRPHKMHFESIWDGKYWSGIFKHTNYRWISQNHPDFALLDPKARQRMMNKPTFDWNNPVHVEDLNKWRRQRRQRATSVKVREASQQFSQPELDYLYQLNDEHIKNMMKETGQPRDHCIKQDIPLKVKNEWTTKFNAKFKDTMPPPHKKPIMERSTNSLMTQRTRNPRFINDFQVGHIVKSRRKVGQSGTRRPGQRSGDGGAEASSSASATGRGRDVDKDKTDDKDDEDVEMVDAPDDEQEHGGGGGNDNNM